METLNLSTKIIEIINNKENIVIVGPTEEGKSHFILNTVIPELEKLNLKVQYFEECQKPVELHKTTDVVIFDEVETFFDRKYLEQRHPEELEYYSKEYVKRYMDFYEEIRNLEIPVIFIITRNEEDEIKYLLQNLKMIDNGIRVKVIDFKREGR